MFQHFLITRFNLVKDDWSRDKFNNEILDDVWLLKRIELFNKYCLPSVVGQTNRNFKWLIFFEKGTEYKLKTLVENLNSFEFIQTIFLRGYEEFQIKISSILQEKLYLETDFLITTRLDNDDAIHKDFIKTIQDSIDVEEDFTIIHFPYGLCLKLNKFSKLANQYQPLNPFISLLEKVNKHNNIKTVYLHQHNNWNENFKIIAISRKNLWLQIIHDSNISNQYKGYPVYTFNLNTYTINCPPFKWSYDVDIFLGRIKQNLIRIVPYRIKKFYRRK